MELENMNCHYHGCCNDESIHIDKNGNDNDIESHGTNSSHIDNDNDRCCANIDLGNDNSCNHNHLQTKVDMNDDCHSCCSDEHSHIKEVHLDHICDDCCSTDLSHTQEAHLPNTNTKQQASLSGDIESGPLVQEECNFCNPSSSVLHKISITRFRVANLCCSSEERILRNALDKMRGIEHIAVNAIGRYAIVKHCPYECCSSVDMICKNLNSLGLGVSIQDVGNDTTTDEENIDKFRILRVSIAAILFFIGLGVSFNHSTEALSDWLFIASVILGIYPILHAAFISCIIRKVLDIHVLIAIAVAGAIASKEYFDASLVVVLFEVAELIESTAYLHVRKAVNSSLTNSVPKTAYLANGSAVKVDDIKIGDILAVRTGEMVLCDGIVKKGEAAINESSLTGEAKPVEKGVGSKVLSGTVVVNGYIEIIAEKENKDSTIKLLEQAVQDVQAEKGYYSGIVDKFSSYWTPTILVVAIAVVVIGGLLTKEWNLFLQRGLILLVLACPCAIVVSAPIPSISAIAVAARNGVLIRGSASIERMSTVTCVAVDKTGTMTKGFFKVCEKINICRNNNDLSSIDPMLLISALERKSTHPLANAIVSDFTGCLGEAGDINFPEVRKVKILDGIGMEGSVAVGDKWFSVVVGNERVFQYTDCMSNLDSRQIEQIKEIADRSIGKSIIYAIIEDNLTTILSLADEIRPEAKTFVTTAYHELDLRVKMLTGDQKGVAVAVCQELNINLADCYSSLLPNDKFDIVCNLEENLNERVLMVGDGINDSTALARATVGVAMGAGGSAMAVESAHVVLMSDNLLLLPPSVELCRSVRYAILENCVFSVAVKIVAIILAIMGLISFWQAIVIDIGTLAVVLINGTRFLRDGRFVKLAPKPDKTTNGFGGLEMLLDV